jgi:hypothetical protein
MTVGELRELIRPLTDECPVVLFDGLFDGIGGALDIEKADIQFTDGEGSFVLYLYEQPGIF